MYEAVYILDPGLEDAQQAALVERFQSVVTGTGATIAHLERWERRRLAYQIQGRREGHYVVMDFMGPPAAEAELGRVLGITEGVMRYLITRMDERFAERSIADAKAAAEARAKAQEEARLAAEAAAAARAEEEARLAAAAEAAEAAAAAARAAAGEVLPGDPEPAPAAEAS